MPYRFSQGNIEYWPSPIQSYPSVQIGVAMQGLMVALDLETTGLDANEAQIIEIGAVKFQGNAVIDTFSTLVDPGTPLPAHVTSITGIRQDHLYGAPRIAEVLPKFLQFVGDATLVGHNIEFDLRFLSRLGALQGHTAIDTYELASVLLPTAPRYNLNALMQELALSPEGSYHRALADAIATMRIYVALYDRLQRLPLTLVQEIAWLSEPLAWRGHLPFAETLHTHGQSISAVTTPNVPTFARPSAADISGEPLFDGGQQQVSTMITEIFDGGQQALIEVATGIDYMPPTLHTVGLWAKQHQQRVIVATDSQERQTALLHMAQHYSHPEVRVASLKSRRHYLCPARLQALRRRRSTSIEELRVLAKVLVWLHQGGDGDRTSLSLRGPAEYSTWERLSAQEESCTSERCEAHMQGICPLFQAKRAAFDAQVVLVDHALLFGDAVAGQVVLPAYQHVIVDNGQRLEESTSYGLRFRTDAQTIQHRLADMGTGSTGLLGSIISNTQDILSEKHFAQLQAFIQIVAEALAGMDHHVNGLFRTMFTFLEATGSLKGYEFLTFTRLTPELRSKSAFGPVRETWSILSEFTSTITIAMQRLSEQLGKLSDRYELAHREAMISASRAASQWTTALQDQLQQCIVAPLDNIAYWCETTQDSNFVSLHSAPISLAPLCKKYLWDTCATVIVLSDVLRVNGSFDFIRQQLGAEREYVQEYMIDSAHDYRASTLIFLPTDMPEPTERDRYQRVLERSIIELAVASQGKLMALFTSFGQLRQSSQTIVARLALGDITVFDQSDGTSQELLLDNFRTTERAVLLGGRSLWTSESIPPEVLQTLVIARLPFGVPSDPLVAARGELVDDQFNDYTLPDAVLRFRQGFAHIAYPSEPALTAPRTFIAVLDRRMTQKAYGKTFLDSLPPCKVVRGSIETLGTLAKQWLNGET